MPAGLHTHLCNSYSHYPLVQCGFILCTEIADKLGGFLLYLGMLQKNMIENDTKNLSCHRIKQWRMLFFRENKGKKIKIPSAKFFLSMPSVQGKQDPQVLYRDTKSTKTPPHYTTECVKVLQVYHFVQLSFLQDPGPSCSKAPLA